jgi:DNA primase small subunit
LSAKSRIVGVQYPGVNVYVAYDYRRESCKMLRETILARPPESLHMHLFKEKEEKIVRGKKELVFDMDITDFYRFCACRDQKKLCHTCWVHMQGAHLILSHLLQHRFGYAEANCLWVFSGGKGLHCFVNSRYALTLSDDERLRLYENLAIQAGDDERLFKFIANLDPSFSSQMETFFLEQVIKERSFFEMDAFITGSHTLDCFEFYCLRALQTHYPVLYPLVKNAWSIITAASPVKKAKLLPHIQPSTTWQSISQRKWKALQELEAMQAPNNNRCKPSLFLLFKILYPVVDSGPFKLTHLIKLPFSVHSSTKNIALPLNSQRILTMNIERDGLSVEKLCSHQKQEGLPSCYTESLRLFQAWLDTYPLYLGKS